MSLVFVRNFRPTARIDTATTVRTGPTTGPLAINMILVININADDNDFNTDEDEVSDEVPAVESKETDNVEDI